LSIFQDIKNRCWAGIDVVLLARKTPTEGVPAGEREESEEASERPQNGKNSFIHILLLISLAKYWDLS
jgi:hypothetical protein